MNVLKYLLNVLKTCCVKDLLVMTQDLAQTERQSNLSFKMKKIRFSADYCLLGFTLSVPLNTPCTCRPHKLIFNLFSE